MIVLPPRCARCAPPIPRIGVQGGDLLPSEESASFLLWAWPRLLGWPRTVNWLFSPVVGNATYPGDLWGLDSHGELLIVETKLDRRGTPQDPFEDFVPYCGNQANAKRWTADALLSRWLKLISEEETFLRNQGSRLKPDQRSVGRHRGVLPYSVHRDATWRWQQLYRDRIVPRFLSGAYSRAVERSLGVRRSCGNPPPLFVGLIATVRPQQPRLSAKGAATLRALEELVGSQRVFLRTLRVVPSPHSIRIDCLTPHPPQA